jgi:hypothetical protein
MTHAASTSAAFADRFVANQIQFAIEDILVNGPPWHLALLRVVDFIAGPPGEPDVYNNRAVAPSSCAGSSSCAGRTTRTANAAEWDAACA